MTKGKWIGTLILFASVLTTCVKEQQHIRSIKSLEEGLRVAVSLPVPVALPANNNKLVHFTGLITTDSSRLLSETKETRTPYVLDPVFGIAARGVRLYRTVEMLQWVETAHTIAGTGGGGDDADGLQHGEVVDESSRDRTYTYDLRWRSDRIDSNLFNDISYQNPPIEAWSFETKTFEVTSQVVVGDFKLSNALIDQIQLKQMVDLHPQAMQTMRTVLDIRLGTTWQSESALEGLKQEDNYFYALKDKVRPQLGDLRISFYVVPAYTVTICGQQDKHHIVPYLTQVGEHLLLLEDGNHSVADFFAIKLAVKYQHNRFVRLFASTLGFISFLVLHPFVCQHLGPNFALVQKHLSAFLMSGSVTMIVAGLNWLFHRSIWGIVLTFYGITPALVLLVLSRTKQSTSKHD